MNGQKLAQRRALLGMSQAQLAGALGTTANSVYRWEREEGGHQPPAMIALALDQLERLTLLPPLRIPHSPFEMNLFCAHIQQALDQWQHRADALRATVRDYQDDGTWLLHIEPLRARSLTTFFGHLIVGRCWIEVNDRHGPQVCWSVPHTEYGAGQTNYHPEMPIIDWRTR